MNSSDPSPSCKPTKVEVPKELSKVNMVNTSLKKLKHHLAGFDVVVKERTTSTAITEGSWWFEHTKACFTDEIVPFVQALKDIFNTITTPTKVPHRKFIVLETDTPKPVVTLVYSRKPRKSRTSGPVSRPKIIKSISTNNKEPNSGCSKHMTGDRSQLTNFVNKFLGTVKFRNDHVEKIMGYGYYHIGNVTISRVYYVEGLGYNLGFTTWKDLDTTYSPLGNYVTRTLKLFFVNTPASFVIKKVLIY
nr:integrase, catalytic region, zinc finger, CCHC-type, peptidase aspartic, catalytic [Tanacetum cinerariifolium]